VVVVVAALVKCEFLALLRLQRRSQKKKA